jgi:hypothetical protein
MSSYSRWAARAAAATVFLSRFRPFEEFVGFVGPAMMRLSAGGHGSHTGHGV